MDPLTVSLAIIAGLSEMLPFFKSWKSNGLLHALYVFLCRDSECTTEVHVSSPVEDRSTKTKI